MLTCLQQSRKMTAKLQASSVHQLQTISICQQCSISQVSTLLLLCGKTAFFLIPVLFFKTKTKFTVKLNYLLHEAILGRFNYLTLVSSDFTFSRMCIHHKREWLIKMATRKTTLKMTKLTTGRCFPLLHEQILTPM